MNNFQIFSEPPKLDNPIGFTYEYWKSIKQHGGYDLNYNNLLKNKKVIIVGPSPSLEGRGIGEWIDSFDVVVRLNKGFPVEHQHKSDLGSKIDIHYHSLSTDELIGGKVHFKEMKESGVFLTCSYPKEIQPFYMDFVRFYNENLKWNIPFHEMNLLYYYEVAKMLGTRPNTGTLSILDLLCYDVKELHITGFTWFRDGWRKTYKDHQKVLGNVEGIKREETLKKNNFNGIHNQKPQEDLVREIYLNDDRVFIDDIMKEILNVK